MPGGVARVYPASGATAMLPLTPQNNYVPTILFCGGSALPADGYGDYSGPAVNTWEQVASTDCQRITPEPTDGSAPTYVKDDNMLDPRTMGQFVALPDGKLLLINGGTNGTAGYSNTTKQTLDQSQMPFGTSLASGPVFKPAIYDPNAPAGSRWSNTGLSDSPIPRLYHSTAILLPDGSVFVAGSNPNPNVNMSTVFPTTYRAEIFYPSYFSAKTRPAPTGIPKTISYGGDPFDITIPASSYSGSSTTAADSTNVVLIRTGFTTHAMNMGQRFVQLNNTYTVNSDGSITLHVAQAPPNPNLLQPGPAFLYVVMNGVPSIGSAVIVGNGLIGQQSTSAASVLPASIQLPSTSGTGDGSSPSSSAGAAASKGKSNTGKVAAAAIGIIAAVGVLGAAVGFWITRRRPTPSKMTPDSAWGIDNSGGNATGRPVYGMATASSDSTPLMPLRNDSSSMMTRQSVASFNPYLDERAASSGDFDPHSMYSAVPTVQSPR
jgi:hypothetical protein